MREAGTRVTQRMLAYEQVLRGTSGFMGHAKHVSREEFRHYIKQLQLQQNYPGIHGVGFVLLVPRAQRDLHIAAVRREGLPGYTPFPAGEDTTEATLVYLEPFVGDNERAVGHVASSDPIRLAALNQSRGLDLAVITSKLTLVQEPNGSAQPGFVMYLPVYKLNSVHDSVAERRDRSRLRGHARPQCRL